MGMGTSSPSAPSVDVGTKYVVDPSIVGKTGSGIVGTNHGPSAGDLGMAEMMIWLTNTMKKTDADVRQQMKGIDKNKELNEQLGGVISQLKQCESAKTTDGLCGYATPIDGLLKDGAYTKAEWYKELSGPARAAFDDFVKNVGSDGVASLDSIKTARETLTDIVSANSSSNEMAMIKLQSAISARGQAIQLVSNMVNAFNETAKSVVGNIR